MLAVRDNIITARIDGLISLEGEFEFVEAMKAVNNVVSVNIEKSRKVVKIKVKDKKIFDISLIGDAIEDAGYRYFSVSNRNTC